MSEPRAIGVGALLLVGVPLLLIGALACDSTITVVGPKVIYCPPLDSALIWAKRDSFPSPLYCPLGPPDTTGKKP